MHPLQCSSRPTEPQTPDCCTTMHYAAPQYPNQLPSADQTHSHWHAVDSRYRRQSFTHRVTHCAHQTRHLNHEPCSRTPQHGGRACSGVSALAAGDKCTKQNQLGLYDYAAVVMPVDSALLPHKTRQPLFAGRHRVHLDGTRNAVALPVTVDR